MAAALEERLRRVQGLDVAQALLRFEGMEDLLVRLLGFFEHDHAGAVDRVKALLAEGRQTEALRAVHTLKGAAGTLALMPVFAAAGALERALHEGRTDLDALWEPLRSSLERAVNELRE